MSSLELFRVAVNPELGHIPSRFGERKRIAAYLVGLVAKGWLVCVVGGADEGHVAFSEDQESQIGNSYRRQPALSGVYNPVCRCLLMCRVGCAFGCVRCGAVPVLALAGRVPLLPARGRKRQHEAQGHCRGRYFVHHSDVCVIPIWVR